MALYSNYEKTIRQRLSRMMDDCVLATCSTGATTTATIATTNPPQYYNKADDYFNEKQYEVYCYSGTNIGVTVLASDWVTLTKVLTITPTQASAYDSTSCLELHRIFFVIELRDAINQAIELYARKYLVDLKDETTIKLVESTSNDGQVLYTYEYSLPTDALYIYRVITEEAVGGYKLTGTVSGAFTLGETVTLSPSGASGILSYGPAGSTYILIREVSGTPAIGDTATGGTSSQTCSTLTAVASETVGGGRFLTEHIVDPRDYTILRSYPPKIKFDENHYDVVDDLRLRLEYQGSQGTVTADTDLIFLPPDDLVEVAATFLPFSKIESNNLTATFQKCLATRQKVEMLSEIHPVGNAKRVIE